MHGHLPQHSIPDTEAKAKVPGLQVHEEHGHAIMSITAMTTRNVSPFVIILKLWHVKEKLINSSFTLQGVTVTNAR